jgi:hypothetical protein
MKLTDSDRAECLEWCRAFIDHNCIFRSPNKTTLLTSVNGLNAWQYYMQVATLNQGFGARIGLLFWDRYRDAFERQPFQICGCENGGVPLACALQSVAYASGFTVNIFSMKKEQKAYGIKNWCEGPILDNVPIILVDDVVGAGTTLMRGAKRLTQAGLTLYPEVFSILCCKAWPQIRIDDRSLELTVFYRAEDFTVSERAYAERYGRPPVFRGTVV